MLNLIQAFVDVALWRKGPQDLPASSILLTLVLLSYTGASFIQVRLMGFGAAVASKLMLIDVVVLSLFIALVLLLMSKRARLMQTLTAVFGVGTLLSLLDIIIRGLTLVIAGSNSDPMIWGILRLMLILLLTGRILMQALETGLFTGIALTFAIALSTETIASFFVPLPQVNAASPG